MSKDVKKSKDYDLECQRCFGLDHTLIRTFRHKEGMDYIYEDSHTPIPEEEREEIWVCRRCDWELMNGYSMDEDAGEISMRREEDDYEEDPINNDPPSWYRGG